MKKILLIVAFLFGLKQSNCQNFNNPSFENWRSPTICETNTPPNGWNDYSNVGLGPDEGNFTLCPTTIPPFAANGNVYARCLAGNPNTGEGLYQYLLALNVGWSYTMSYDYCGSNLWGGSGDCVWHLFLDDVDVNLSTVFSSVDTVWHTNYFTFTATSTMHKIGLRAYTPTYNGGGSAAIDNFDIWRSKTTDIENDLITTDISVYPNPFKNSLSLNSNNNISSATFILTDLTGKIILQQEFTNSATFNTEELSRGIYFYEIINDNKIEKNGKLMK